MCSSTRNTPATRTTRSGTAMNSVFRPSECIADSSSRRGIRHGISDPCNQNRAAVKLSRLPAFLHAPPRKAKALWSRLNVMADFNRRPHIERPRLRQKKALGCALHIRRPSWLRRRELTARDY
jgi:hypothetical protein